MLLVVVDIVYKYGVMRRKPRENGGAVVAWSRPRWSSVPVPLWRV